MKKSSIIVVLAVFVIVSLFGVNRSVHAEFIDVPSRASKEVQYLSTGGIAHGSSATTFGAEKKVTRMEAAAFIGRALQLNGKKRNTNFKDVGSGIFASGYIQSAVETGILSGYDGGRFLPYKEVTRGEMAVMLSKAFGYQFGGKLSGAANALTTRGIAKGLSDGTFGADQYIKRSDFAVFLARAINPELRTKAFSSYKKTLWTNTGDLNVRTGPSVSYASVGKLAKDVKVIGAHSIAGWTYIKSGRLTGFVSTAYLRDTEILKAERPPAEVDKRIAGQTIILDPGHGGSDPGAVGFGVREKDVVLSTGLKVNNLLKQTPFKVKMTRSDDRFITINQRSSFARKNGGSVFVSIHANASSSPGAKGTETIYYSAANPHGADSKLLAAKIQDRMVKAWRLSNRGIKSTRQLGRSLGVLNNNSVPAALAELGFITNKSENQKLKSDYWQTVMAKAIYDGILDYYKAKGYKVDSFYSIK
ncbi:N-acetylmuramoyl-L-alanine amidase [Domibacillus epiphyticus]|uniref:Cell wall hydrolase n=1 Tax=Domibacillus epiphyticus TaxID=1714355 RepID=A0A1V2A3V7_9BACI|nr:N-acetylmuramoyl-L-alanine amidase [Domibacillus epiphyticus]OMP65695.1 cell wall hydrolase [Domibacillus epiphyticus]